MCVCVFGGARGGTPIVELYGYLQLDEADFSCSLNYGMRYRVYLSGVKQNHVRGTLCSNMFSSSEMRLHV